MVGGAEEDRTPDLRIANATLSQLSYRPIRSAMISAAARFAKRRPVSRQGAVMSQADDSSSGDTVPYIGRFSAWCPKGRHLPG